MPAWKRKPEEEDPEESSGILECLLCTRRYSKEEILQGRYQPETLICSRCYAKMQKSPHHISCFGKPTVILPSGKHLWGYNPRTATCRTICPDHKICARVFFGSDDDGDDEE